METQPFTPVKPLTSLVGGGVLMSTHEPVNRTPTVRKVQASSAPPCHSHTHRRADTTRTLLHLTALPLRPEPQIREIFNLTPSSQRALGWGGGPGGLQGAAVEGGRARPGEEEGIPLLPLWSGGVLLPGLFCVPLRHRD